MKKNVKNKLFDEMASDYISFRKSYVNNIKKNNNRKMIITAKEVVWQDYILHRPGFFPSHFAVSTGMGRKHPSRN